MLQSISVGRKKRGGGGEKRERFGGGLNRRAVTQSLDICDDIM